MDAGNNLNVRGWVPASVSTPQTTQSNQATEVESTTTSSKWIKATKTGSQDETITKVASEQLLNKIEEPKGEKSIKATTELETLRSEIAKIKGLVVESRIGLDYLNKKHSNLNIQEKLQNIKKEPEIEQAKMLATKLNLELKHKEESAMGSYKLIAQTLANDPKIISHLKGFSAGKELHGIIDEKIVDFKIKAKDEKRPMKASEMKEVLKLIDKLSANLDSLLKDAQSILDKPDTPEPVQIHLGYNIQEREKNMQEMEKKGEKREELKFHQHTPTIQLDARKIAINEFVKDSNRYITGYGDTFRNTLKQK